MYMYHDIVQVPAIGIEYHDKPKVVSIKIHPPTPPPPPPKEPLGIKLEV